MRPNATILLSLLSATLLLHAAPSAANGRFPAAGQIVVDPGDVKHLVIRTTYGILTTRDGGKNWDWICEESVQWTGQYDPSIAVTGDGSVIAGIYDHLGVSHGDTCNWQHAVPLDKKNIVDVSIEKKNPQIALALTSNNVGAGSFTTQLWRSPDNASTWAQAGINLPSDFQALTVDVSPSNPLRAYVSGLYTAGKTGAIERSADGGKTWERVEVSGSDVDHAPYIAALDPDEDKVLYVRLAGTPGRLLRSTDAGTSWKEIFTGKGLLKGFALAPDGKTILVGGETDGVWRASVPELAFKNVSKVGAECLMWSPAGVYVCADEFNDSFTVGFSKDQASSFTSAMHLACVRGPLVCAADSNVGKLCPAVWPATAELIDQPSCPPDQSGSGGADGAGGKSSTATATGTSSQSAVTAGAGSTGSGGGSSADSGSAAGGCQQGANVASGWPALIATIGLLGFRRARSKRERPKALREPS